MKPRQWINGIPLRGTSKLRWRPHHVDLTWRIIPVTKWLIAMVIVSTLWIGLWDPFEKWFFFSWPVNGGDPNHLLTGMILQVVKLDRLPKWKTYNKKALLQTSPKGRDLDVILALIMINSEVYHHLCQLTCQQRPT